ncbi:MAG: MFS transporter, partial [Saprospiraceae bacterium]
IADEEKAEKAEGITALLTKYSEKAEAATVELKVAKFFAEEDFQTTLGMSAAAKAEVEKVQKQYNKGADWVGVCFAVYNGFAAVFAFLLVWMAKQTSRKMTHFISLLVGGLSFVSIFFIKDPNLLIVSFVGVGLAWASILSMPYAILAGSIPSDKMGYYMGVFNFFIVIPQLVAATILGFLVSQFFGGQAIYALILGGISMVLGAISVLFVEDKDDVVAQV